MAMIKGIPCIEFFNDPSAPWVVLLHGYGADASDLSGLAPYFKTNKKYNYLFPEGILKVQLGGGWQGRAWWNIDFEKLQELQSKGQARSLSTEVPPGLDTARKKIIDLINAMPCKPEDIVIGGFSQGAMLAVDVYFHHPEKLKGLMILSGNALALGELKDKTQKAAGKTFFQSHGEGDPVLGMGGADKLYQFLKNTGMTGDMVRFRGGHEIPMQVIERASQYLTSL